MVTNNIVYVYVYACEWACMCVMYVCNIVKRAKITRNVARFRGSFTGNVNISLKLH